VKKAFKSLGVYLRFWQPALKAGNARRFEIMMVNDEDRLVQGDLRLILLKSNSESRAVAASTPFAIPAFGAQTYELELLVPNIPGEYWLRASATESGKSELTVSRRNVRVELQ
jgi:hypothetical protein